MRVSVVIPFYNGDDIILPCITSILNGHLKPDKIYIINNSSTSTKIHSLFDVELSISVIDCKSSIGFGRACNIGAFHAINDGFDIVIFLNQDTIVYNNSIEELISPLKNQSSISICVPLICNYENNHRLEETYYKMYVAPIHEMVSDSITRSILKPFYEIKHAISGACLAIRSNDIKQLGLFNPMIWMYGEDTELFSRYISHSKKSVIVPSSIISHAHSHAVASGNNLYRIKRNIHKNTPYSIWNVSVYSLSDKVKKLIIFIIKDYGSAINKKHWKLIFDFIVTDLTLPFRILKFKKYQDVEVLKAEIKKKVVEDQI
jgi:GT2 family glycosyltransferase